MARLQFRSATKSKGFAPIQLSKASLSEMEKRDAKLLKALERKHAAEIQQRETNLQAMEANAEYTDRITKENRQIEIDNLQREQTSINQIAERDRQQAQYDQQATESIIGSIVNLSSTASKVAAQRTAKQLEDQTERAMNEDLNLYKQLEYENSAQKQERAGIKSFSLIEQEAAESGEPRYKTARALAAERGLGAVGQRVLFNRLYTSSYGTLLNKELQDTEEKFQLPTGKKFSGAEAGDDPEMLKVVMSSTRAQVDGLMRTKYGITESLYFSPSRKEIDESNKVRVTQAESRAELIAKQILGEQADELLAAGENLEIAFKAKVKSSDFKTATKAWRDAVSSTDDLVRQEKIGNTIIYGNETFIGKHPERFAIEAEKGRKAGQVKFEAEQEFKKNKFLQNMTTDVNSVTKAIELGGEDAVQALKETGARNGVVESDFHPQVKLAISSMRKNSKEAEEEDLRMAIVNKSLTIEKINSYENGEVKQAAATAFDEQEQSFFGADYKAEKKAILADAKSRTNVTDGGDANTKTRRFYTAVIREIKKFKTLNPGASYPEAKDHVDKLILDGEKGIYNRETNPEGAPSTNPFARGEDEQNNYIYPQLHGIDTDRLTYNDNLLIKKGDAIADVPYALGSETQMERTREDVALGKIPIYPPLMVRALEKLNANPRYKDDPLTMSEFFQRQQDAINKVTGKNFQLLPPTEEQNWMLSLPIPLYKKVTSGNLFQFQHVEAVVRGTVGQKLRPSMGGNSGTFNDIVNTARASGAKFPELVAAQWALESNSGKSPSGMNNFFGMKATSNETSTSRMTNEYRDGALNTEAANFKDYASKEDSVNDLVNRWYKNYESYQGVNNANSIEEAAQMLQQQGYATDPNYANKLIQILNNNIGKQ